MHFHDRELWMVRHAKTVQKSWNALPPHRRRGLDCNGGRLPDHRNSGVLIQYAVKYSDRGHDDGAASLIIAPVRLDAAENYGRNRKPHRQMALAPLPVLKTRRAVEETS